MSNTERTASLLYLIIVFVLHRMRIMYLLVADFEAAEVDLLIRSGDDYHHVGSCLYFGPRRQHSTSKGREPHGSDFSKSI